MAVTKELYTYLLRDFIAVLLEIHDGVRDFDVDRVDDEFNVERSQKAIGHLHQSVYKEREREIESSCFY